MAFELHPIQDKGLRWSSRTQGTQYIRRDPYMYHSPTISLQNLLFELHRIFQTPIRKYQFSISRHKTNNRLNFLR